jgi:hypothetical protein
MGLAAFSNLASSTRAEGTLSPANYAKLTKPVIAVDRRKSLASIQPASLCCCSQSALKTWCRPTGAAARYEELAQQIFSIGLSCLPFEK